MKSRKQWLMSTGLTFSILAGIVGLSASAAVLADFERQNVQESTQQEIAKVTPFDKMDWETANYYAYMDLEQAEESIKPIILEARKKIIFDKGWAADGITAYVEDAEGNIIEQLPHFSELFPADWEIPSLG